MFRPVFMPSNSDPVFGEAYFVARILFYFSAEKVPPSIPDFPSDTSRVPALPFLAGFFFLQFFVQRVPTFFGTSLRVPPWKHRRNRSHSLA